MTRAAVLCAALVALLAAVAIAQPCPGAPDSITIDSSIRIYSDIDWKYGCHTQLELAKSQGNTKVNFIPTHFWNGTDADKIPLAFAIRAGRGLYLAPSDELVAQYTAAMAQCFKKAAALGFKWIEVTPHLDDANPATALWRNELRMDPFTPYGGKSYVEVLIDPLMNALIAAVPAGVDVYMSIQGEMNGVLIHYPEGWLKLVGYMREKFAAAPFKAKIGINNNFNKICAECPVETNWAPAPGQFDLKTIAAIYNEADFIAISAYAPQDVQYPRLRPVDMENSIVVFEKELGQFGIPLKGLLKAGKGFHYSEFGIGGAIGDGSCPQECPCKTPLQVAKYPFQGIGGPYNPAKNPWLVPGNAEYMRRYFAVSTQFASKGTGGNYKVDCIFLWITGSYDIQGLYPESTVRVNGALASYRDPAVVQMIQDYNTKCKVAAA